MKSFVRLVCFVAMLMMTGVAMSQDRLNIEISGVGASQIPIAVADFEGDGKGQNSIISVVKADLARTGLFKFIGVDNALNESSVLDFGKYKQDGIAAIATGSIHRNGNGMDVHYRLSDVSRQADLSALGYSSSQKALRLTAHRIADDIYEKLTGIKGMFATRIAYVVKMGRQYRLEVADSDGANRSVALTSSEPIISPAWSPDGTKVAYVSFEKKKPVVYVQNLLTGQRKLLANYKGNNSAPAWSPDGSRLALALSKNGHTHIYTVSASGQGLKQLTSGNSISTEPQFSSDGSMIYFTSDRGGSPQIYKMSASGGAAQRVTFYGNYNISPRISPDGKYLAYISRRSGYQLYLMELATGQELRLSETTRDECPSFSPNGQFIMYANGKGRGDLSVVSIDGRVRQRLTMKAADVREPAWGPYLK